MLKLTEVMFLWDEFVIGTMKYAKYNNKQNIQLKLVT